MVLEALASFAELIGNAAFLTRYGKSRTPIEPVSGFTACLVFLLLGLLAAGVTAALFSALSVVKATTIVASALGLFGFLGWRMRGGLGFPISPLHALFYAISFASGAIGIVTLAAL
jgi:hypothetical protein